MKEQILSSTRIVSSEILQAENLDKIITYLGGADARIAIIHDNRPFPYRDELIEKLQNYRDFPVLDRVFPNPKSKDIALMVEELSDSKPSVIIGIGGGSSLDSAKAVAMILSNGGDLDDYLGPQASRKVEKKVIKLILIPTTAGTGSEVTKFGVYTARSGRKYTLNNPMLQADLALLIGEFTKDLPPQLTAATGFDALSHALETLWNKNATQVSDIAATDAAIHLLHYMETAYSSSLSGSVSGRTEMMIGAAMAGIAFNLTGTAAVHALSFILSEEWHTPHGVACAFTLEDVLKLNAKEAGNRKKLAKIARAFFEEADEEKLVDLLYQKIVNLKKKMDLPLLFSDLGIKVESNQIPKLFERSFQDPKMLNNIPPANEESLYTLLRNKI